MTALSSPPEAMPETPTVEIDKALRRLDQGKKAWAELPPLKKAVLLQELMTDLYSVSEEWIATSCRGKRILRNSPEEGEEWIGGFMPIMRNARLLYDALTHYGAPPIPNTYQRSDGQWVAQVFPLDWKEKLMFMGFKAEVWIKPGHKPTQGSFYKNPEHDGRISLVLGAGNQGSIGPMDCLYKLFVEGEVCILKLNPVNDYLGPYMIRAFRALIEGNFITIVYGGSETGKYLCSHELVDNIHITGSDKTHDSIVWGAGAEGTANKEANTPVNTKKITSELGCVTPIVVIPGEWTDKEIDYQAKQIASMVTHNASFNCNAGKAVLIHEGWALKEKLKQSVEHHLNRKGARNAFYPGAAERYQRFIRRYESHIICGEKMTKKNRDVVPWTIIDVPAQPDEYALVTEAFCGILSWSELSAASTDEFTTKAVDFCNESLWGSLSAHLLIDPKTEKSKPDLLDQAIAKLEYGAIAVNCWSGVNYGLCTVPWGAFPKHTLQNIESGIGMVHNTLMLDHPQKGVVKAPFTIAPTPAWFFDNKNLIGLGKQLLRFEKSPSVLNFIRTVANAARC